MKQREIWLADLNLVKGSEQYGVRPVIVISGNAMNDNLGSYIVCPLTRKLKNYSGCVLIRKNELNGLDVDSEVITFQIRVLSKSRFLKRLGIIENDQLEQIIEGLNKILTY
jgi:mRNA interferase MazF